MENLRDLTVAEDFTADDYKLMETIHDEMVAASRNNGSPDSVVADAVRTLYRLGGEKHEGLDVEVHASPLAMIEAAQKVTDDVRFSSYGNLSDYGWLSYVRFGIEAGITEDDKDFQDAYAAIVGSGLFASICLDGKAFACRVPSSLNMDEDGQLHSLDGKAVAWPDGCGQHFIHGVYFTPSDYRKAIDADAVTALNWNDIEQRAAILRVKPVDSILDTCDKRLIDHTDECGGYDLYEIDVKGLGKAKILTFKAWSCDKRYAHFVPNSETKALTAAANQRGISVEDFRLAEKS